METTKLYFCIKSLMEFQKGSFGIHVANLTGIKSTIIESLKEILHEFSKNKIQRGLDFKPPEFKEKNDYITENFKEIEKILNKVELDNISPKEALDILYVMKKKSKKMLIELDEQKLFIDQLKKKIFD